MVGFPLFYDIRNCSQAAMISCSYPYSSPFSGAVLPCRAQFVHECKEFGGRDQVEVSLMLSTSSLNNPLIGIHLQRTRQPPDAKRCQRPCDGV
jgi:hypothetical protein